MKKNTNVLLFGDIYIYDKSRKNKKTGKSEYIFRLFNDEKERWIVEHSHFYDLLENKQVEVLDFIKYKL